MIPSQQWFPLLSSQADCPVAQMCPMMDILIHFKAANARGVTVVPLLSTYKNLLRFFSRFLRSIFFRRILWGTPTLSLWNINILTKRQFLLKSFCYLKTALVWVNTHRAFSNQLPTFHLTFTSI